MPIFRLLTLASLAASNGEARRLVRGGGVRINDTVVDDETRIITLADLRNGAVKLSVGRKQHVLIRTV